MTACPFVFRLEQPSDAAEIDTLHAQAFGPGRFARAAFRLREDIPHDPALSFVATADGALAASVRLTPIRIGGRPALLLGPLAVKPPHKGRGAGRRLVREALGAAASAGHRVVLLVGDEPYYGPLGFRHVPPERVQLPGPVDTRRVLIAELTPGAHAQAQGPAKNWRWG